MFGFGEEAIENSAKRVATINKMSKMIAKRDIKKLARVVLLKKRIILSVRIEVMDVFNIGVNKYAERK